MTVPTATAFSSVPPGGVITKDLITYAIKVDATSWVNLATGALTSGVSPSDMYFYFPGAQLVLS